MMLFAITGIALLLIGVAKTENRYYFLCLWIGLGNGYWAMFVTLAAEQFGTNIRNTAATTIPNMVRGSLVVMLLGFNYFKKSNSVIISACIVGAIIFGLALISVLTISETHHKDLDYVE